MRKIQGSKVVSCTEKIVNMTVNTMQDFRLLPQGSCSLYSSGMLCGIGS